MPRSLLHHRLDLGRADQESAQAQRVAHARQVNEAPVGHGGAQIAGAVVAVGRDRLARGLRVAVIGGHAARGREEFEFARLAVREDRAGLRVTRAHAGGRAHRPPARQAAFGRRGVFVLAREQGLDFARAVQADQLQAGRIGALHDVGMRGIERRIAEETQV